MTVTVSLVAPNPYGIYQTRGATYTADAVGLIANVAAGDVRDLENMGCLPLATVRYIGRLLGANMNVTTDQIIPLFVPAAAKFRLTKITVLNASVSLTTAVGGVYTALSKGGTAVVANTQVFSSLTTPVKAVDLTLANTDAEVAATQLYLSLTTAQGAPATADIYVFGDVFQ